MQGRLVKQEKTHHEGREEHEGKTEEAKIEEPYPVPAGWVWTTIKNLRPEFQNGVSKRASQSGVPTPVLRLANIVNGAVSLDDIRKISLSEDEREKYAILPSDILITRVNGSVDLVGAFTHVRISDESAYCDHFIRMRFSHGLALPDFISLFGRSPLCRIAVERLFITTAGQKTVNQGHISSLRMPLPPLAEQQRIVAKVNALMVLCDALEATLTQSRADVDTLADATVHAVGCGSHNGK